MRKIIGNNIFFISILFIVIPFFLISFYSVPSADDYETAHKSLKQGYITFQINHWNEWNGRYVSTAIQSAPLFMNFHIYGMIAFILLSLFVHAVYLLLRKIFASSSKMSAFLGALSFLAIYILLIPITSNFYWLSGSATYFLPIILFLYLLSILYKIIYKKKQAIFSIVGGSFLIFLIIGTSETSMFLLDIFLLMLFMIYIFYYRKIHWHLVIFGSIAFISTMLVVLAPGNAIRKSRFSGGGDLFTAIKKSISSTIDFSYTWLFNDSILWLVIIIIFLLAVLSFNKHNKKECVFNTHPLLAFLFIFLFTCSGFFVPYFSFGTYGPDRTLALIQFVFLFSLLYFIAVLANYFVDNIYSNFSKVNIKVITFFTSILLGIVLFITFATNQNLRLAYNEISSSKIAKFYTENKEIRDILINNSEKIIVLPSPSHIPKTNSFRGKENFKWMAKYHMKKYNNSMEDISMDDYRIIFRNLGHISDNAEGVFVFFDKQSKSLIYRVKDSNKDDVDNYDLRIFPKKDILYGKEREQGYVDKSFSWKEGKTVLNGYEYYVVHLPKHWELDKIMTSQVDSENEVLWSSEIKL